jgi:chemotaxis protein histidine kinase CheA
MTSPLGTADFFALEAGECLDRLETLVNAQTPPPGDEFLRMARVLRGSALMATQTHIARAAVGLESLARAYRDHRHTWDPATRELVAQAVEEFRLLVRRVREWNEADTTRAARLGRELETLVGKAPEERGAKPAQSERQELNTGVRAFVAREGALIASALDRAARALRTSPTDREPLYNVIRRMQSLRGLAELGELAPLPDILDGIELAVGDLTRLFAPPPGVDEVMDAAAQALTRISRDVAERGRPDPDAEEARRFTELLLRAFAVEQDVVPIESLYREGDPQPVSHPSSQPQFAAPEPFGPLELVSHGEHLCQSADLIASARSGTERDLRLYNLLGALRTASAPSADPVAGALGIFARSTQEALAAGVAGRALEDLVNRLREAGTLLRAVGESDDRMLISRRLLDVAHRVDGLRSSSEPDQVVPIDSLGYDSGADVVPIESLAPAAPAAEPRETAKPTESKAATTGLESSFRTYEQRIRERAPTTPALDALLARTTPSPEAEEVAVAIGTLCYRGQAALERANLVRNQLAAQLTADASLETLQPLLQELLDLVPLALAES